MIAVAAGGAGLGGGCGDATESCNLNGCCVVLEGGVCC